MDRRRAVALILGLVIGLGLLSRWAMRPDEGTDVPASVTASSQLPATNGRIESAPLAAPAAPIANASEVPIGGGVFRGRVIDAASRRPVREFTLEFPMNRASTPGFEAPLARSFQANDGRFEYRGLPPGVWTVHTTARGYQRFELADLEISESTSMQELLIPMRAGLVVRGRVFDETSNEGLGAVRISFREAYVGRYEGNFRARPSTTSNADGSFALDGVAPGAVKLIVEPQNYVSRELDVFVSAKAPPLEIALSAGGTIAGYLAGADGLTPVAGFASLRNLDENNSGALKTGDAGEFEFKRVVAGRYQLVGRGGPFSGQREITLSHNERLEGIVLAMSPGHSIRGRVSGLRPNELARLNIFLFREEGQDVHSPESQADANGAYRLTGISPGRVRIVANAAGRRQVSEVVDMPADRDLTVDLEFKDGSRLTGRVTRGGKPLAGAVVAPRSMPTTANPELFVRETITSADGDYAFDDVPDGEYAFGVDSYFSPTVRIAGDTVFDIDVPNGQVAGRVLEGAGAVPVVGAVVGLTPAEPGANALRNWAGGRSDHFGQFSILGLQAGDFVLTAYKPGYELYRVPFAYGTPIPDVAIRMRSARGVEVRVRDAETGKTLNNARALELLNGSPAIVVHLSLDQNGVSHIPSGLAGSSLRFSANGYLPTIVSDWNGQQLDVSLRKQPLR